MIEQIGKQALIKKRDLLYAAGYFANLMKETLRFYGKRRTARRVMIMQIFFTGVEALGTIALISMGIGAVIIIQGTSLLPQFGQQELMYKILLLVITRELGPLLTAFIITARSGSAITTELGNMVISHEVEAYISVGINPIYYLAVPRLIATTVAMVVLTIYSNFFGLFGSFMVTQFFQSIGFSEYIMNLASAVTFGDIASSILKSITFGVIIGTVSTFYGFKVSRAVTEVPQKTIKSIANTIILCIIANAFITVVSYMVGA